MKILPWAFGLFLLTTPAFAGDTVITLSEKEVKSLIGLLDLAVKQGGLPAATPAAVFLQKLQGPPVPPGKPEDKPADAPTPKK